MASDLLRRQDRLLDAGQRADLAQLAELHVLQALCVLGQAHLAHAALDVVHEPALAVDRNDGDFLAGDVACILQNAATRHDVLVDLARLDLALAHLDAADGRQGLFERRVGQEVGLAVALLGAVDGSEDADRLADILDLVILGDVDHVRRTPVELVLVDFLWPVGRVVAPGFLVGLACHAGDDVAVPGVGLVLALGVEVEEHRAVGIEDRLDQDALVLVVLVLVVLVDIAQTPCTEATAHCLLEGIVVGLVGHAVLLIGTVQAVARLGQLVVLARLGRVVHRDAVVAVLVDDANDRQVNLVHLEARLVLVDVPEWAFPLAAGQAVEAPVLQTLQALVAQCSLDVVELRQRVAVQFAEILFLGHACHISPLFASIFYHLLVTGNGLKSTGRETTAALRTPSHAYRSASMTWFFLSCSTGSTLPVSGSVL